MFDQLKADVARIRAVDPAARSNLEIFLLYSGLHALRSHRRANWLYRHNLPFFARAVSQLSKFTTGIEIHPAAQIGRGVFIDHGSGVVIGETAVVGDDCVIYQGATLGGTGKETGKRHPTIGNGVTIGAGAKVLGPITIGDNCKVGAGSIVLKNVPPDCTVVGNPGRIVRKKNVRRDEIDLDQVNLPDPMLEKMQALYTRLTHLEECLARRACEMGSGDCADGCMIRRDLNEAKEKSMEE